MISVLRTHAAVNRKHEESMVSLHSFPPIETAGAHLLILGTMPGRVSLQEQQYYAHPRNAFWRIVGKFLGFDADRTYEERVAALAASGIALWDVLKSCTRKGSLDSAIAIDTIVPNDFRTFFAAHPHIRRICFNGANAENLFRKYVRSQLADPAAMAYIRLPSTSPANATIPLAEKIHAWRVIASDGNIMPQYGEIHR